MDPVFGLFGLIVGLFLALAPFLAWASIFMHRRLSQRLDALERQTAMHRRALERLVTEMPPPEGPARPGPEAEAGELEPKEAEPGAVEPPPEPEAPPAPAAPGPERQAPRPWAPRPWAPRPAAAAAAPAMRAAQVERALTSRWLVWLGGLAVALSAVFLFSYAVEQGWLGPGPRVGLGLALGLALVAGGEWAHRRPLPDRLAGMAPRLGGAAAPDYVPQALTAAGVFALYASVYAAHALYALIGAAPAFAALAAVSAAGLALAMRQGWFVALLGMIGGYAMPALLESATSAALPVFVYLGALSAGCLGLMRLRAWPFLAVGAILGSAGWPLVWMAGAWRPGDEGPVGVYAVGLAALCALLASERAAWRIEEPGLATLARIVGDTAGLGFLAHGLVLVAMAVTTAYGEAALVFLGLYAALGIALGLWLKAHERLGVLSALVVAMAFLFWPDPGPLTMPEELARQGIRNWGDTFGPIEMPAGMRLFARAALGFALLYGLGGYLALARAATPVIWAGLSAAVPLYLLALAYWRIGGFGLDIRWGALAAATSVAALAAAAGARRLPAGWQAEAAVGIYAAASTAALALAFTTVLREAWLTVALSAELPALAWISARLGLGVLRPVAWLAAGTVLVRLLLNPAILDYQGGIPGLLSWVVYGYGLPAAAFLGAARLFGEARRDPLAALCEAGAAAFAVLAVALQLRAWTSGTLFGPPYGLFDMGVQSAWWLVAAALMLRREAAAGSPVALYGGRVLAALAAAQVGLGHLLLENPLLADNPVGTWPLANLLALAYLVPAALLWLIGGARFALPDEARLAARAGTGVLLFAWLTFEVRRAFQGSEMAVFRQAGPVSDAELYAYSAAWMAYALALLALGILARSSVLRYASLTVLIVAVIKVFLVDMADLTGLYRVVSFLGLGLALIGIGHVYRRFVFRPEAPG